MGTPQNDELAGTPPESISTIAGHGPSLPGGSLGAFGLRRSGAGIGLHEAGWFSPSHVMAQATGWNWLDAQNMTKPAAHTMLKPNLNVEPRTC